MSHGVESLHTHVLFNPAAPNIADVSHQQSHMVAQVMQLSMNIAVQ